MLERLAGNSTIAFDGILRATFPIPIDLLDQEKTTFHLPNGLLPTVACLLVYACTTRIPSATLSVKERHSPLAIRFLNSGIDVDKAKD
ncbi:hypothetical protein Tco_0246435 [Tanacetum coccineum]